MHERLFNLHPDTGAQEVFHYDEMTDTVTISHHEDVTATLEDNKTRQTSGDVGWIDKDKSMRKVAEIPVGVQYLWFQKYGIRAWRKEDWAGCIKLLNSNEWRYLRTNEVYI